MNISKKITKKLILLNILDIENTAIYEYGVFILCNYLIIIIASSLLSLYFNLRIELYIFTFFIMLLRPYVGGFHFKDYYMCFITSILELILISYILLIDNSNDKLLLFFSLLLSIGIIITSPVDTRNRRLSREEKVKIKHKIIFLLTIGTLMILYSYINMLYFIIFPYFLSLLHCIILLFFGIIDNKLGE